MISKKDRKKNMEGSYLESGEIEILEDQIDNDLEIVLIYNNMSPDLDW